jgi:pyruvate/2-oxoglutarate dehydrogenase complex dihydrolipoamide acyltransferase (E2) component
MTRPRNVDLRLPDLGLSDQELRAGMWLVQRGERVVKDDRLLEIVAEDVTVDLPAPATGLLAHVCVESDDELVVGQLLAVIRVDEG